MTEANVREDALALVAGAIRRLWWVKGMGRVALRANRWFVARGATAIRPATLRDGARLLVDLRSTSQWHAYYSGEFDDLWVRLGTELLDRDALYLDVGANIGVFAVRVAHHHRVPGQCHCFEPLPSNAERLRANIRLNGLEEAVIVHPFGLSDAPAHLQLLLREDFEAGSDTGNASILITPDADAHYRRVDIEVRRLDDEIALLDGRRVGVIKVDVEGHEDQFFRGAKAVLERDRPIVLAEICRTYLAQKRLTPEAVYVDCLPAGYAVFRERRPGEARAGRRAADRLVRIGSFDEVGELENILLCPEEKTGLITG